MNKFEIYQAEILIFYKQILYNKWRVMLVLIFSLVGMLCNAFGIFMKIYTYYTQMHMLTHQHTN